MTNIEVELFGQQSNVSVVRMPGRAYPAVAIQGDTLSILWETAREAAIHLKNSRSLEAREELGGVLRELDEILNHYEAMLRENGMSLPYSARARVPKL
jgi:hypothetical protein